MQDGVSKAINILIMLIWRLYLTKKLLIIGTHNKHCFTCSIAMHKNTHKCFRNGDSSCSIESYIIVEGFNISESMHGLLYMWMIGDGDSSFHLSMSHMVDMSRRQNKLL